MICYGLSSSGHGRECMFSFEAVSSLQVCPVTVQISLSLCVPRMDAPTPVPASPAVWVSKTTSLSLDLVSPRIPVILTSAQKAKGKFSATYLFSQRLVLSRLCCACPTGWEYSSLARVCSPSTWGTEAGGFWVRGRTVLHAEMSQENFLSVLTSVESGEKDLHRTPWLHDFECRSRAINAAGEGRASEVLNMTLSCIRDQQGWG